MGGMRIEVQTLQPAEIVQCNVASRERRLGTILRMTLGAEFVATAPRGQELQSRVPLRRTHRIAQVLDARDSLPCLPGGVRSIVRIGSAH